MARLLRHRSGFTMTELLLVAAIIAIVATMSLPGLQAVKRRNFEGQCIAKLANLAVQEKRYFGENAQFGTFEELREAGFVPRGYRKEGFLVAPMSASSVRPYVEMYSLVFTVPSTPNSLFFKIDAYPARQTLGLRTFNISVVLDNDASRDTLFTEPPVREGLSLLGEPVGPY